MQTITDRIIKSVKFFFSLPHPLYSPVNSSGCRDNRLCYPVSRPGPSLASPRPALATDGGDWDWGASLDPAGAS